MTTVRIAVCGLVLAVGCAKAQANTQPGKQDALTQLHANVQTLQSEIATLRSMLAGLLLDRHREAIRQIKAELETVNQQRTRVAELDRSRQQDLRDLEDLLTRREAGERLELESTRADLAVTRAREINEQSEAIGVRENDLLRRLETEQQAIRRIENAWVTTKGNTP